MDSMNQPLESLGAALSVSARQILLAFVRTVADRCDNVQVDEALGLSQMAFYNIGL